MSLKKVLVVINPAASKDIPILAMLNDVLAKHDIQWEVLTTQKDQKVEKLLVTAKEKNPDAVAIFGGDGLVTDVAAFFYKTGTPLIILPAGTANVLAKELEISTTLEEALKVFVERPKKASLDVSLVDKKTPMFLRIEHGVLAEMVKHTQRESKNVLGQFAYPLTALQELLKAKPFVYTLKLDGKEQTIEGVGLMIANVGNIGISGISLQKNMSSHDGKLDVCVLQTKDIQTLIALGSSTLMGTKKPAMLKHWQAKKVLVTFSSAQSIICDDKPLKAAHFTVEVQKQQLTILK